MWSLLNMNKSIKNVNGINVMLVGNGDNTQYIASSKFLRKLYTTSSREFEEVINIKFNTFSELATKCKALQIDLVIVEDEKFILQGIADVLRKNFINCAAINSKWTNLKLSNSYARKILSKYNINVPPVTLIPTDFPLLVKSDGFVKIANSVEEVINIRKEIYNTSAEMAKNTYLEKFLDGEKYIITSLFDGKNLISFPIDDVKQDVINCYNKKLHEMLTTEKADFVGFINSKTILYQKQLYNTGFSFEFKKPNTEIDILYILWLAIYQKLNEINL